MEDFYNLLKQDGEYTKDYDSFKKDFGSPESQRALYDAYKAEGRVTREFPEWQKKWFSGDKMVDVDALKKRTYFSRLWAAARDGFRRYSNR